ncbi:Kynurenine formamidase [Apophysomyces sp. BC1034]|nr:Kynurenine formamidase [Apophysomyces sp. BC1015]KAG0182097.1 Kynurenine formamidase [Apophysomyces sp. BC1021]KAG0192256.1 Kynurenine formamidase [Apophysomyces sp. BC1034]
MDITTHTFGAVDNPFKALDIYTPRTSTERTPLLVFIHGGAWRSEDKADHADLAEDLARKGFTVAAINYRLSLHEVPDQPPSVQHPAHIVDSLEAVEFLYRNPGRYDPSRIYLVGHSAGAHIAMMLVLDPTFKASYVRGIVGADGIYDIPLLVKTFPGYMDFIGQAFGLDKTKYLEASPVSKRASPIPPVLIVQSLEDTLIDVAQANAMANHLKSLNADVRLDTSVNGDHYEMLKTPEFVNLVTEFVREKERNC